MIGLMFSSFRGSQNETVHVFMIGDSTMANKSENSFPETGWGMVFHEYFNDQVEVENFALNGRSTKRFIDEGHWQKGYDKLKLNDYVFIEFGHNDEKENQPDLYTTPFTTFRANLERYVRETREKGAIPILLSPVVRRNFNKEGTLIDTHGMYPLVTRMVAEAMDVPFIDLQLLTELKLKELGIEGSKKLYMCLDPGQYKNWPDGHIDNTHFTNYGAHVVAELVVGDLKKKHLMNDYLVNQKVSPTN